MASALKADPYPIWPGLAQVGTETRLRDGGHEKRPVSAALAGLLVVGLGIQLMPFGWDRSNPPVTAEPIVDGEMPPAYYTRSSPPEARLSDAELQQLIDGLGATLGSDYGDYAEEDDEDDD